MNRLRFSCYHILNKFLIIFVLFVLISFIRCGANKQHDLYVKEIDKSLMAKFKDTLTQSRKDSLSYFYKCGFGLEPYCNRKKMLFTFPNDTIIVSDYYLVDDYVGTEENKTVLYFADKGIIISSFYSELDTVQIDRNFILNNKENADYSYRFVEMLKRNRVLETKNKNKCSDRFYSLIINQKIKKIYRVCNDSLYQIK